MTKPEDLGFGPRRAGPRMSPERTAFGVAGLFGLGTILAMHSTEGLVLAMALVVLTIFVLAWKVG